jgi:Lon protease-like protein
MYHYTVTNFIPIFPLALVVYPGEELNLHIFEPRYKQLIGECLANGKPFGIPSVIQNKVAELGTLVQVASLEKAYDNGEMDIRTKGLEVFRLLELVPEIPDKLYGGAIVSYPENDKNGNPELMLKVVETIRELHRMLNVTKKFRDESDQPLISYDVAHHAGLSLEEEYELLGLMKEIHRQEYLRRHLQKVLPIVAEMEALKEKVKLNGHFRNLDAFPFNFG